jgi:prepilin-type N-terminal cleavage/methylation domain-containing protein
MMRQRGFSLIEVVIVGSIFALAMTLALARWQGYNAQQRLRFGTAQVATDLRTAQERAKAERAPYTVTFTASSSAYTVARSGGGFVENTSLPDNVVATADQVVTFSAFGRPDAARTITVQNSFGTASASINATGGITYQTP